MPRFWKVGGDGAVSDPGDVGRRRFLTGTAAVSASAVLAACTNSSDSSEASGQATSGAAGASSTPGKHVTIAFSSPGADHGWQAAIIKNAKAQAAKWSDVTLELVEAHSNSEEQRGHIETLIAKKPDVMVLLPFEGQALTEVAREAMNKGIPVVNLDRVFSSPLAYRTWVGGDNYGMGVNAGHYVGRTLQPRGGDVVEIVGLPQLQLTKERSKGFADALKSYPNVRIVAQQAADFLPDKGLTVMGDVLNRVKKIDAVWNHDDDQGIGVLQAIRNAGREDEFFMVGGAGSAQAMQEIKKGGVLRATVLYSPSMASTSVNLARLIAQGRGMDELAEREVPSFMTLYSAVVTKDNVDQYLPVGF
jgi:ribose transport system substrate-binding protein